MASVANGGQGPDCSGKLVLLVAEQRFRRLAAPERMKQVFLGVQFQDGVEVKREEVLAVA